MNKILQREIIAISVNFLSSIKARCYLTGASPDHKGKPPCKNTVNKAAYQATGDSSLRIFSGRNLFLSCF